MTTGQQADPALSAAIDAWHGACHDGATIEDGMRRVVNAVRSADVPPLTELVTTEDVEAAAAARTAYNTGRTDPTVFGALRAALESFASRLVARLGRTP